MPPPGTGAGPGAAVNKLLTHNAANGAGAAALPAQSGQLMLTGPGAAAASSSGVGGGVVAPSAGGAGAAIPKGTTRLVPGRRQPRHDLPKPEWHAPWKLMRVISGHMGWVRCVAVDPTNSWYATGSADRTIKIWDLASGTLKLTLTGHISTIRGLAVSERSPYLFSAGEDKMVRCWDLEYNRVIRDYHGHLSGVYCLSLHPTLDVLCTGTHLPTLYRPGGAVPPKEWSSMRIRAGQHDHVVALSFLGCATCLGNYRLNSLNLSFSFSYRWKGLCRASLGHPNKE